MNMNEYKENYLNDINVEASNSMISPENAFLEKAISTLIEAEEIDDFNYGYFNALGINQTKMIMDGFYYDEYDKSLVVVFCDFTNSRELVTLTNTELDKYYLYLKNLILACEEHYILKRNFEESSIGYELANLIKMKQNEILKYRFYIITDRILSDRIKKIKKENISNKIVELNIWDLKRFCNLEMSNKPKESIDIVLEEKDAIECIKAVDEDNYSAYLAVISGKTLANLYIEYGSRLLEGNVRSFLSVKGKTNKGIRNTILNEPKMFFAYNNGIAATATEIMVENNKIKRIKDLQIINGGQTTASIANVILQDKKEESVDQIFVPMKISIVDEETSNILVPNISRWANSQNKVDESDFFSNHPFHIRIEEYSRKIFAPPIDNNPYETIWFYERAKGQYNQAQMKLTKSEKDKFKMKNPKNQVIKKVDLSKYINTFDCKPQIVSKGSQASMKYFAEVITKKWDVSNLEYNSNYFKKIISYAIIFKETEKLVANQQWYKDIKAYRANIVTYSISIIINKINKEYSDLSLNYKRIWDEQKLYPELYSQLLKTTKEVFNFITRDDRETLNVTEWCKKDKCWELAQKEHFEFIPEFCETLISKTEMMDEIVEAKKDRKLENQLNGEWEVVGLGSLFWKKVYEWGMQQRLLTPKEQDLLILASKMEITGKTPSSAQSALILKTRDRLIEDGMPKEFK